MAKWNNNNNNTAALYQFRMQINIEICEMLLLSVNVV